MNKTPETLKHENATLKKRLNALRCALTTIEGEARNALQKDGTTFVEDEQNELRAELEKAQRERDELWRQRDEWERLCKRYADRFNAVEKQLTQAQQESAAAQMALSNLVQLFDNAIAMPTRPPFIAQVNLSLEGARQALANIATKEEK